MDRFTQRQSFDRSRGPSVAAAGDGMAQGQPYTAVIRSGITAGLVQVSIGAFNLSATMLAHIQPDTPCSIGETCLVLFDEQKIPWVVQGAWPVSYGPFTAFSTNLPLAGEEKKVEVEHGMPTTPVAVWGGLQDGFYSACLGWRWEATATTISITFHTLQAQTKVEGHLVFMAR